jgi:hypothetical protein
MSGDYPAWMTEHAAELEREEAKAKAIKLAEQQAMENFRREQEKREAEEQALALQADHVASEMARETYQRLLGISATPEPVFNYTFRQTITDPDDRANYYGSDSDYLDYHVPATRTHTHEVNIGSGWLVKAPGVYTDTSFRPQSHLVPGLWLDMNGRLRTDRPIYPTRGRFDWGGTPHDFPQVDLDTAYPLVSWKRRGRDPEPVKLDGWAAGTDTAWANWRYINTRPATLCVHMEPSEKRDFPHADHLARYLTMLLRRKGAI